MKIKLTPEFSYIVGITKYAGVGKGIGVSGDESLHAAFGAGAIAAGLTSPDKLLVKGKSIRFYHSAYETYFSRIQQEAVDKYKHLNDYAAAYLAGIFDAVGGVMENSAYLRKCDRIDDAILENLGFGVKLVRERYWIGHHEQFLKFIDKFRRVEDAYLIERVEQ